MGGAATAGDPSGGAGGGSTNGAQNGDASATAMQSNASPATGGAGGNTVGAVNRAGDAFAERRLLERRQRWRDGSDEHRCGNGQRRCRQRRDRNGRWRACNERRCDDGQLRHHRPELVADHVGPDPADQLAGVAVRLLPTSDVVEG